MTTLRFLGELSLAASAVLAVCGALVSWWLYRRETQRLDSYCAWLLPLLRSSAVALCILVLCQPVIRQREKLGEPGQILILLDGSQSMAIHDQQYTRAEKVRIAQALQWIPSDSDRDSQKTPDSTASLPTAPDPQQAVLEQVDRSTRYSRAVDFLLAGKPGLLEVLKEGFEIRVARIDDEDHELLYESSISVSGLLPSDAQAWLPKAFGSSTNLSEAIKSLGSGTTVKPASSPAQAAAIEQHARRSAIVLLSDGQHNVGEPPLDLVERIEQRGDRIFTVGFGATSEPDDLSIEQIESPERLFHQDMVRGTISIKDHMPPNSLVSLEIKFHEQTIWERRFTTEKSGTRSFEFSFPLDQVIAQQVAQLSGALRFSAIPLTFDVALSQLNGEVDWKNNSRKLHVTAVTQQVKMLILDGRSRWETRYLRNVFERDPTWMVDCRIVDTAPNTGGTNRVGKGLFPASRRELLEYDIIILGEVPPGVLRPTELQWLTDFVELSGGGVIVIDGARGNLRGQEYRLLHRLLPIEWESAGAGDRVSNALEPGQEFPIKLTTAGSQLGVLQIVGAGESNETAWHRLPPLVFASRVRALPGAEVLAELGNGITQTPLFATRQFGAGRVLFVATDETWRWRFRVADTVHRRLWNQIGRWVMRLPMAVHGEYVSLDSGKSHYALGDRVEIRARLQDMEGKPSSENNIEAVISSGDRHSSSVSLSADPHVPGVFRGQIDRMSVGVYDVKIRAPGYSEQALNVSTRFEIQAPASKEMSALAKNSPLLRKLAEATGGKYLDEERAHELVSYLQPLSGGRIVESDFPLWSSFWWFVPIMCLLTLEWWLRKRANLV